MRAGRPRRPRAPLRPPATVDGSRPAFCPLSLSVAEPVRMLDFELPEHPVYDAGELRWFDDDERGTGMLAFLTRRPDRVVDHEVQPGLRLDPATFPLGGGNRSWNVTDIDPARLEVTRDGVVAEAGFWTPTGGGSRSTSTTVTASHADAPACSPRPATTSRCNAACSSCGCRASTWCAPHRPLPRSASTASTARTSTPTAYPSSVCTGSGSSRTRLRWWPLRSTPTRSPTPRRYVPWSRRAAGTARSCCGHRCPTPRRSRTASRCRDAGG